jgi:hypothetical protein
MMEAWAVGSQLRTLQGRRVLDTAEGVLVGLRGCDTRSAFHELVCAAQTHGVPVFSMAAALVKLATGSNDSAEISARAQTAALEQWGRLLDASPRLQPNR